MNYKTKPECIFCKIINGEIPSSKIWEDENFLAILDVFPNTKGMTLVMPKNHFDSYVIDMEDKTYCQFFAAAKKVAKILEKALKVKRVAMVMEGMGVDHAHIKLYPLHGLDKKFKQMLGPKQVYFDFYQGYLTTLMGPKADEKDLKKLAEMIKKERE